MTDIDAIHKLNRLRDYLMITLPEFTYETDTEKQEVIASNKDESEFKIVFQYSKHEFTVNDASSLFKLFIDVPDCAQYKEAFLKLAGTIAKDNDLLFDNYQFVSNRPVDARGETSCFALLNQIGNSFINTKKQISDYLLIAKQMVN